MDNCALGYVFDNYKAVNRPTIPLPTTAILAVSLILLYFNNLTALMALPGAKVTPAPP